MSLFYLRSVDNLFITPMYCGLATAHRDFVDKPRGVSFILNRQQALVIKPDLFNLKTMGLNGSR